MAENILIRKANAGDLEAIFNLYAGYMFDSYLLKLGKSFVEKYLKIIVESEDCITLIAQDRNPVGFIMAALDCKKIFSRVFFNMQILRLWTAGVIKNPLLGLESLAFLLYPFTARLKDINAELLFIAVRPDFRKQGIAGSLISRVLLFMKQKNIARVKVSALIDNKNVNALLRKEGFKIVRELSLLNRSAYLYSVDLNRN